MTKRKLRKHLVCQLEGCENSLGGMRSDARYCCNKHGTRASANRRRGTPLHNRYKVCQLKGCNNRLIGFRVSKRYCCSEHWGKAYKNKRRGTPLKQKYIVCQLDGCDNSIIGFSVRKKYCSEKHASKAYKQSPEGAEKRRTQVNRRRSEERQLLATFTTKDWQYCLDFFENRCAYCGDLFGDTTPHQDHFIPVVSEGSYTPDNIICACPSCNMEKHAREPEDWCTPEQYERVVNYLVQQ